MSVASVPHEQHWFEEHSGGLKLGELLCGSFHSRRCQDAPRLWFLPCRFSASFAAPLGRGKGGHQMLDVLHESSSIEVFGDVALCFTHTMRTRALFFPRVYSQRHRGFTIAHSTLDGLLSVHWGFVGSLTSPNSEVLFRLGFPDILFGPVTALSLSPSGMS